MRFAALKNRLCAYLQGEDSFIQNCYAGADEGFRVPIRIISERAAHSLFARTMSYQELNSEKLALHRPEFTVLHAPDFVVIRKQTERTRKHSIYAFGEKLILIGGTAYAGEIMKMDLHRHELFPAAAASCYGDALLCELRQGRKRCCNFLWPFGHREDNVISRSGSVCVNRR